MPKKNQSPVTKNVPAFLARTQFGQILDRAAFNKERFLITRKGKAKAIILGVEDFLETIKAPGSLAELEAQVQGEGETGQTLEEKEQAFEAVRRVKTPKKYTGQGVL